MPTSFFETKPRAFDPVAALGSPTRLLKVPTQPCRHWPLGEEIADTNQRNGERVLDKMAVAAKTLGWPTQVVDAARTQLKSIAEIQVKTLDQMMDAWEEQLKLPNPMAASSAAMRSKLTFLPGTAAPAAS
jgi:hypothetical protein